MSELPTNPEDADVEAAAEKDSGEGGEAKEGKKKKKPTAAAIAKLSKRKGRPAGSRNSAPKVMRQQASLHARKEFGHLAWGSPELPQKTNMDLEL